MSNGRNTDRDRGDKRMNYLMGKINSKIEATTNSLIAHFYVHVTGSIIFFVAAILFLNAIQKETKPVFIALYVLATIIALVGVWYFVREYEKILEIRLRDLRNVVDVAMHHENIENKSKEDKGDHIPNLF